MDRALLRPAAAQMASLCFSTTSSRLLTPLTLTPCRGGRIRRSGVPHSTTTCSHGSRKCSLEGVWQRAWSFGDPALLGGPRSRRFRRRCRMTSAGDWRWRLCRSRLAGIPPAPATARPAATGPRAAMLPAALRRSGFGPPGTTPRPSRAAAPRRHGAPAQLAARSARRASRRARSCAQAESAGPGSPHLREQVRQVVCASLAQFSAPHFHTDRLLEQLRDREIARLGLCVQRFRQVHLHPGHTPKLRI